MLATGQVLVAGGEFVDGVQLSSVELYDPRTESWTSSDDTPLAECHSGAAPHAGRPCPLAQVRARHTASRLPDGTVLIVGGEFRFDEISFPLGASEIFDPATGIFRPAASLSQGRFSHRATLLPPAPCWSPAAPSL